jgi:hypothetical protein
MLENETVTSGSFSPSFSLSTVTYTSTECAKAAETLARMVTISPCAVGCRKLKESIDATRIVERQCRFAAINAQYSIHFNTWPPNVMPRLGLDQRGVPVAVFGENDLYHFRVCF